MEHNGLLLSLEVDNTQDKRKKRKVDFLLSLTLLKSAKSLKKYTAAETITITCYNILSSSTFSSLAD